MQQRLWRSGALGLLIAVSGCLTSEDNLADQTWRCDSNDDCGDGWKCNLSERTCEQAFEGANGVFSDRLVLGMVSPIEKAPLVPGAELIGRAARIGFNTYFAHVNRTGGIEGRRLELRVKDDNYDPSLTGPAVEDLITGPDRKVFALAVVLGTDPSLIARDLVLKHEVLFFSPASGADALEPPSPDRYVFNFRPRYSQEIEQLIDYMTERAQTLIGCTNVAVFTSVDDKGDPDSISKAAFDGARQALRRPPCQIPENDVKFVTYRVNTIDVASAVKTLLIWMADPDRALEAEKDGTINIGVPMLPAFDAGGAFVKILTDQLMKVRKGGDVDGPFAPTGGFNSTENAQLAKIEVQFASSSNTGPALVTAFKALGTYETEETSVRRRYGAGTIFAATVPDVNSNVTGVRNFKAHLEEYKKELPEEDQAEVVPSPFSLEGYLSANLWGEALKKHGRHLTTESFIDTLISLEGVQLGVGPTFGFSE